MSSIVAVICLMGFIPTPWASTATISYFIVDFINIMLNDFYYRVPSYQKPDARKLEYCHHILCCTVGVMSEFFYQDFCTFESNPFIQLMFAEVSTPVLMIWRITGLKNDYLGGLFYATFIIFRVCYHGFFFIPECIRRCHYSVGYGFGIPYDLMNFYFVYVMIKRNLPRGKKSEIEKSE